VRKHPNQQPKKKKKKTQNKKKKKKKKNKAPAQGGKVALPRKSFAISSLSFFLFCLCVRKKPPTDGTSARARASKRNERNQLSK
jgi:hypothetical protein